MSLCAKLVPSNQRDVAPAMQMESLGTGQVGWKPQGPQGASWGLRTFQAEVLCQVQ